MIKKVKILVAPTLNLTLIVCCTLLQTRPRREDLRSLVFEFTSLDELKDDDDEPTQGHPGGPLAIWEHLSASLYKHVLSPLAGQWAHS